MNSGSEAADQMVREGIQITEAAVKLSALGAKKPCGHRAGAGKG